MPEADYSFQATKETRTFGAFVGHTINAAFNNCSRAKGEPNPNKEDLEKVTSKAQLVAAAKAVPIVTPCAGADRRLAGGDGPGRTAAGAARSSSSASSVTT